MDHGFNGCSSEDIKAKQQWQFKQFLEDRNLEMWKSDKRDGSKIWSFKVSNVRRMEAFEMWF